ncbi:MAG: Nitronate monooxygenase [Microbacteriaceae bacterium]|nr:Nitronate monooxygenase [Microbacteriaceae bacterium]
MVLPVVCAPMTAVTGPELVIQCCLAGIMAVLPRHNAQSEQEFDEWLRLIRRSLDAHREEHPDARVGPVAVNFARRGDERELRRDLESCGRYGVSVIVSAMGDPSELVSVVHGWGGIVYHDATSIRFAEKAMAAKVDGITCIVAGGGGHSGLLSPLVFVPQVRKMFDGTILMAGALTSGAAVRAAEILGADLAYMGTRFIATRESSVSDDYRDLLVESTSTDLRYTSNISAIPANWLSGSLRNVGLDPDALPVSAGRGDYRHLPDGVRPWKDIWSAGQGIDLIDDLPAVRELVARIEVEYREAVARPAFGHGVNAWV